MSDTDKIDIKKVKLQLAHNLLKFPDDVDKAIIMTLGGPDIKAMTWIKENWLDSESFNNLKMKLLNKHGEEYFLPSKADVAREIYTESSKSMHLDDKIKGYELYCKLMGMIKKDAKVSVNVGDTNNKIMLLKDHGSDEEWRKKIRDNQKKLMENRESPNDGS